MASFDFPRVIYPQDIISPQSRAVTFGKQPRLSAERLLEAQLPALRQGRAEQEQARIFDEGRRLQERSARAARRSEIAGLGIQTLDFGVRNRKEIGAGAKALGAFSRRTVGALRNNKVSSGFNTGAQTPLEQGARTVGVSPVAPSITAPTSEISLFSGEQTGGNLSVSTPQTSTSITAGSNVFETATQRSPKTPVVDAAFGFKGIRPGEAVNFGGKAGSLFSTGVTAGIGLGAERFLEKRIQEFVPEGQQETARVAKATLVGFAFGGPIGGVVGGAGQAIANLFN